jgi:serine/threonine protein kinase
MNHEIITRGGNSPQGTNNGSLEDRPPNVMTTARAANNVESLWAAQKKNGMAAEATPLNTAAIEGNPTQTLQSSTWPQNNTLEAMLPDVSMREFLQEEEGFTWLNGEKRMKFDAREKVPLTWGNGGEPIGHSAKALVFEADARRMLKYRRRLACKIVNCEDKEVSVLNAWNEVRNMFGLRHPHVVALVGAYIQGDYLGILMYPVARWTLHDYMRQISSDIQESARTNRLIPVETITMINQLPRWFVCLGQGLSYLHKEPNPVKHKDIKPKNILIDHLGAILLTDFDISHKYKGEEKLESHGPTPMTYQYCAPEVATGARTRDLSTDVFSLGCVFLEMATLVGLRDFDEFLHYRKSGSGDHSYHANLTRVTRWVGFLQTQWQTRPLQSEGKQDVTGASYPNSTASEDMRKALPEILGMLAKDPARRPLATSLRTRFRMLNYPPCADCHDPLEAPSRVPTIPERDQEAWDGEPPLDQDLSQKSSDPQRRPTIIAGDLSRSLDIATSEPVNMNNSPHPPESLIAPSEEGREPKRQPTVEYLPNKERSRRGIAYYPPLRKWYVIPLDELKG